MHKNIVSLAAAMLLAAPLLQRRTGRVESLEELLFALALLGDDRAIAATYSAGRRVHARSAT